MTPIRTLEAAPRFTCCPDPHGVWVCDRDKKRDWFGTDSGGTGMGTITAHNWCAKLNQLDSDGALGKEEQ